MSDNLPQISVKISFPEDGYPPMELTEGNMELLEVLNKVSQDMNLVEVDPYDSGRRGAADILFVADYVDGLDGLEAMGNGAHGPNETINLSTYKELTKRAALLIYYLTRME